MALTKVSRGLLSTGIVDNSNATAITLNADESATFAGSISVTGTATMGGLTTSGNILLDGSGNPTVINKTSGAGNNPVYRLQADTNYWDLQGTFSNSNDELFFMYNGSTKMAITSAGNVGIGSVPDSWSALTSLDISRSASFAGHDSQNAAYFMNNLYFNGSAWTAKNTGTSSGIVLDDITGHIAFYQNASASADTGVALTERLRIDSTGAMISSKSSGIFFKNSSGGTSSTQLQISNTGGDMRAGVESSSGGTIQTGTSAYAAVFGNQGNYPTQFTTNGSTKMTINADGIVVHNGVSTYSNSVSMMNNVAYSFDIPVGNEGGAGNVIEVHAMYDHYFNFAYGASLITLVGKRGTNVSRSDIKVITTTNGGAWSVSAPNATTLRLTKSAGSYPGPAFGHIMVRFRKS